MTLHANPSPSSDAALDKTQRAAVKAHGSQAPPAGATMHTAANHPWLTADRGWVLAGDLREGEQVVQLDGTTATVIALAVRPGEADYYNLTVAQDHTYAVDDSHTVVHNTDGPLCDPRANPHQYADDLAHNLQAYLPDGPDSSTTAKWWKTMGAGVARDQEGSLRTIIGTSEDNGYLRPEVLARLDELFPNGGYSVADGPGHAEVSIIDYARAQGWTDVVVGAGRPVCSACVRYAEGTIGLDAIASDLKDPGQFPGVPYWKDGGGS